MDKVFLEQQLLAVFARYHATDARYRHTAFSSKEKL
jgi:hypothetical protein